MGNARKTKGFYLSDSGVDIYAQKELERHQAKLNARNRSKQHQKAINRLTSETEDRTTAAPAVTEQVSRFIDEGNPNTQPPAEVASEDKSKPGTQPEEAPDLGKPDQEPVQPRGLSSTEELAVGEEESGQTIEEEIGENTWNFPQTNDGYYVADQQLAIDIKEAIRKEGTLADVVDFINVTADNGVVTLNGSVLTEQEKMTAGDKATAFAGFGKVNNRITVAEEEDQ